MEGGSSTGGGRGHVGGGGGGVGGGWVVCGGPKRDGVHDGRGRRMQWEPDGRQALAGSTKNETDNLGTVHKHPLKRKTKQQFLSTQPGQFSICGSETH